MQLSDKHLAYWRRTRLLTIALLVAWTVVTFGGAYYAIALNEFELFGFPLGFYLFAQGALLFYLLIAGIYVLVMNRLDRAFGVAERR
ncbi:DUF4212 domain-containing protein [Pseudothauera nasutitermitis]|uniref:DUF4212 domain-containing protein n=1 Tax=Pseudothauera nasutitermitis TaxID=2565930 RepID=A0A4S4ARH8_9RHOO|nr:DUF4212 domain-containing protein [Pseudothauera nasutitermitis]THF62390.1 DUF4212 domain-containing protein [Pseudothauera nasutitermitis]